MNTYCTIKSLIIKPIQCFGSIENNDPKPGSCNRRRTSSANNAEDGASTMNNECILTHSYLNSYQRGNVRGSAVILSFIMCVIY